MNHFFQRLRLVLVAGLLLGPIALATPPGRVIASDTMSTSTVAATGCQWTYYPISGGNLQPEQLLYNDPSNTPVIDLSLGNPFKGKSTHLASTGSTDFNGDNQTDVFRTYLRGDGSRQWQYSSGGTGAWQDLAFADGSLPASVLQFGEFNGDTQTDVFANFYSFPNYSWLYSPGGTASFVPLHTTNFYADRLALGDFNGDGVTDVFTATQQPDTFYHWGYFPGGSGSIVPLAYAATDPALLRFGDFNGDGKTDVFAATQQANGSTQWLYSGGGANSYTNLITSTVPYAELQFGDFDGDSKTDVLAALPQNDGGLQIVYWPHGLGPAATLGHIPAPAPALRVGDFNGDGVSDLLAWRCGMKGPLAFGPLQTLATFGYNTFNRALAGDVNGDGRPDVILVSTCQNPGSFGNCATHHLQVGAALGSFIYTDTLIAPQPLSTDDFTYSKVLAGDFDGDGKTDLALIKIDASSLTIEVAHSTGDGHFTLDSPQTFGNETWGTFNPAVGDYNGDGKADLAFATVCHFADGSCSVGDNNSVYVAMSTGTGTFTLGSRQDLGPTGWTDYTAFVGDFNGDGKTDLVFNSTCQKTNYIDSTCTIGDANYVYTALSNGLGSFTLSARQTYGSSGWADYPQNLDLVGDVNGDGRSDVVWSAAYQASATTSNNLVMAGLANPDGTFQLGSVQNFGSTWTGRLTLVDLNHDGKADLLWNNAPLSDTDVDTYAAATSNGQGAFKNLGLGSVYTGQGYFRLPENGDLSQPTAGLTLVSTRQDSISNALFVITGVWTGVKVYLPSVLR